MKIQQLRKAKGISAQVLADSIGVSVRAVNAWEQDLNVPKVHHVRAMAQVFDVPSDSIDMPDPAARRRERAARSVAKLLGN